MNIMITKEEADRLFQHEEKRYLMGSHLYGTNTEKSDKDYIIVYKDDVYRKDMKLALPALPNIHQFQYKDLENNIDYIFCTKEQFWQNQTSGDSTINSDIILFKENVKWSAKKRLKYCRTYKVIKAYLGFAKRDLKDWKRNENKIFHAWRSLYTANCLMNGYTPNLNTIRTTKGTLGSCDLLELKEDLACYRVKMNKMYEAHELENYYIPRYDDQLLMKLLGSNNTRQFKY